MKNWKKIGALLTALVCTAGTAAACGGNDDGPEEGATVVTVWLRDFEDWSNEVMTSIMDDFNKDKTDMLHISYRFISEDGFGDALAARAGQRNGARYLSGVLYQFVQRGAGKHHSGARRPPARFFLRGPEGYGKGAGRLRRTLLCVSSADRSRER